MARASLLLLLLLASCAPRLDTTASLLDRLPTQDATVVSIDFTALRNSGILKLFATMQAEPDYEAFVKNSGFDYQRDLDSALVAFSPGGTFFLVRGRFDWNKLADYARANKGSCYDQLCRMAGSTPERRISFLPLKSNLMALAVSTDDLAAARLKKPGPQRQIDIPQQPIWLSAPNSALQRTGSLPVGARMFASALRNANQITLTLGPHASDFEMHFEAVCRSPQEATVLSKQLGQLTKLLRDLTHGKGGDLPGTLAAGSFQASGVKVFGYWPIPKALLEGFTGG